MSSRPAQFVNDPAAQALVARGRVNGYLTFDEVTSVISVSADPEQFVAVTEWLDSHGIALIDSDEPEKPAAPLIECNAPEVQEDDTPPVYQRDPVFEQLLRSLGVPFADAVVSFGTDGTVFDAELTVAGEHALRAWLARRNAVPQTGLCPVLERDVKQSRYWDDVQEPEQLDPQRRQGAWSERFRRDRTIPRFRLTPEQIRIDATQNITDAAKMPPTPWTFRGYRGKRAAPPPPAESDDERAPPEPNLTELFSERGPFRAHLTGGGHPDYPPHPFLRLRLYPTAVPWEVGAYRPFGGWNDCPWPAEQLTMLRHWHELYGVEMVSHRGDWYELFVPRPPRTRHQAYWLCREMEHFGEETFYNYGRHAHPDPIEAVRTSHYWYFWWD